MTDVRSRTTPSSARRRAAGRRRTWILAWNNPSLHAPGRRKEWVACDAHREHLGDFLARRSFLLDVTPLP